MGYAKYDHQMAGQMQQKTPKILASILNPHLLCRHLLHSLFLYLPYLLPQPHLEFYDNSSSWSIILAFSRFECSSEVNVKIDLKDDERRVFTLQVRVS